MQDIHKEDTHATAPESIWLRALWMIVIMCLFSLAQSILALATVLQFLFMLINREPNARLAEFGASLGKWAAKAARFQTAASEEKPWPWTAIE